MALILPFRLINKVPANSTLYATAVFVQNTQSASPVKDAPPSNTEKNNNKTTASFEYFPWQTLNPSSGAVESFTFTDDLFLVARFPADDTHEQPAISDKTPVYCGQTLILTRKDNKVGIAKGDSSHNGPINILNPAEPGPGAIAQLDWYLGDVPIGRINDLAPGATGQFQLGEKIYFLPFLPSGEPQQIYKPKAVEKLQSYQPPLSASADIGVRIYFALPAGAKNNEGNNIQDRTYVFCPPSRDWRPTKAGDPPPCRRFEGPSPGSEA